MMGAPRRRVGGPPSLSGEPGGVAIVQADHVAYRGLAPADLPGVRLLVDGRAITSPEAWAGTPRITIGGGNAPAC